MKQKETQKRTGSREAKRIRERAEKVLQRMDAVPTLDNRPKDEILGYDKNGIPNKGEQVSG